MSPRGTHIEYEAKWLDIDVLELRARLARVGAERIQSETLMRRKVYDEPTPFAVYNHGWVRVRDEGTKVTLTYKKMKDRTASGMMDITVTVSDFEKTCAIFDEMQLAGRAYQETRRETWRLGQAEITIDTWPWIPTFVEIEAPTEQEMWAVAEKLELPKTDALHGSVENVYQTYYDVSEEDVDKWERVAFDPIPDWLEKKRRR